MPIELKPFIKCRLQPLVVDCRGVLMLEVVFAVVVFTLVGVAVLSGLSITHISGAKIEGQPVGENIARNQMEHIFSLQYQPPPHTYPSIDVPSGYSVTGVAEEYVAGDPNIEKVLVTIDRDGENILLLETLRVND